MTDRERTQPSSISEPTGTSESVRQLVAQLEEEQRARWQHGERVLVEVYLEQHPRLQAQADGIVDLLYNEFLLREQAGEAPRLEDYLKRFPQLADQLRDQFEVHGALRSEEARKVSPGQTTTTFSDSARSSPLPDAADLPVVPGYEIVKELGRGGMGLVYLARHLGLKRLVALKMIRDAALAGAKERERFRVEAEAIACLQHPNIVQIFEVGESRGAKDISTPVPYLALEYVEGGGLDRKLNGTPQPAGETAQLIETLARAVHAAHQRGVIHRDLKPANVLLTADGTPKITDFGLAKRLDVEQGQTQTQPGAIVGTPSYMAPEQAAGKTREVSPAVDVYALGAILYECLTGRPPFKAASPFETLQQVVADDPVPPRRLQFVPRDLETICLKCLEKPLERRYGSARDLADDLGRFLRHEPIRARRVGVLRKAWAWTQKRPLVLSVIFSVLMVLALWVSFGLWTRVREADWNASYLEARVARLSNRPEEAFQRLQQAAKLRLDGRLYDEALMVLRTKGKACRQVMLPAPAEHKLQALSGKGAVLGVSQDGRLLLLRDSSKHFVLDLTNGDLRWRSDSEMHAVSLDPQGRMLATQSTKDEQDDVVQLWTLKDDNERVSIAVPHGRVTALRFAPNGQHLAIALAKVRENGENIMQISMWDVQAVKPICRMNLPCLSEVHHLAFSPANDLLATCLPPEKRICIWNTATGELTASHSTHQYPVSLTFSPDGKSVACLSFSTMWNGRIEWGRGGMIEVLELATGNVVRQLSPQPRNQSPWYMREQSRDHDAIRIDGPVAYTPDGKFLISVINTERSLRRKQELIWNVLLWEVASGEEYLRIPGRAFAVCAAGPHSTLATFGQGEVSLPAYIPLLLGGTFELPISHWDLQEVQREVDATGLASCRDAPVPDASGMFKLVYPLNLLEDWVSLHYSQYRYFVNPSVFLFLFSSGYVCLFALYRRQRQRRLPSSTILVCCAGIGFLNIIYPFYGLLTAFNTPEWTWLQPFNSDLVNAPILLSVGIQLLVGVARTGRPEFPEKKEAKPGTHLSRIFKTLSNRFNFRRGQ